MDNSCSVCSANTIAVSPLLSVNKNSRFGWDNDSTMELLGLYHANVQLRFCPKCLHSARYPKYDMSMLYGDKGGAVRKKIYEQYFPDKTYGVKKFPGLFGTEIEFLRFYYIARLIAKYVQLAFNDKSIRILDWGGGDGYVSNMYANVLGVCTGLKIENFVYDYTDWGKANNVDIDNLKHMEKFDIVIIANILEHTHDQIDTVKSTLPFLKDKGVVICEIPDDRHNIIRGLLRKKFGLSCHVTQYSRRSLHYLFKSIGLGNIHTIYQNNSSYRGERLCSVIGIAQSGNVQRKSEKIPSLISEIFSLVKSIIRRISFRLATR